MRFQSDYSSAFAMANELQEFMSKKDWGPLGSTTALLMVLGLRQMAVGSMEVSVKTNQTPWLNFSMTTEPLAKDVHSNLTDEAF